MPAIANVALEYNSYTPDWVWVTVTVDNLDPAAEQAMLFVSRGPAADCGEGRLQSNDFMLDSDGQFYFGMWLPDRYFPEGYVPVELHLCSGDKWSERYTFDAVTPEFMYFWQDPAVVVDENVVLYRTGSAAEAEEKPPVTPTRSPITKTPGKGNKVGGTPKVPVVTYFRCTAGNASHSANDHT